MKSRMRKKILIGLIILFAIIFGIYPITYFIPNLTDPSFLNTKNTLDNLYWSLGFKTHIVSSGLALLIGWVQFINKIKVRTPLVHRLIGYIFFISVFIGAISGLFLSIYSNYIFSKIGFGVLSMLWLLSSFFTLYYIIRKQFDLHYNWALRTYSFTFSSVTFRILFIILTTITIDYDISYILSCWFCWVINITIVELIIQNSVIIPKLI